MNNDKNRIMTSNEMRSTKNKVLHGIYLLLYAPVKYLPIPIVSDFLRYLVLKLFMGKKLKTSRIAEMVTIMFPWNVEIGVNTTLNQGVIIDGTGGVKIGNGVRIAPNVIINTADHIFSDAHRWIYEQGFKVSNVHIDDDIWIGANTIINKGVHIDKGSVIGAGAVVTKDVPSYSIAAGVPCKVISRRG